MSLFVLVGCGKKKQDTACEAKQMYTSGYARGKIQVAMHADAWGIASAEHGFLAPHEVIEPYDTVITDLTAAEREVWATSVVKALPPSVTDLAVLAGKKYREPIHEKCDDVTIHDPFDGKNLFEQMPWLSQTNDRVVAGASLEELL